MSHSNDPSSHYTTDGFYNFTTPDPTTGRVQTPIDLAGQVVSKTPGFLSDAYNWASGFADNNPMTAMLIVGTAAALFMAKAGMNFGMLSMFGDGKIGKWLSAAVLGGVVLLGASVAGDWVANKGAEKRIGHTGRHENTATLPAGTASSFNEHALGRRANMTPPPSPQADSAPELAPALPSGPG